MNLKLKSFCREARHLHGPKIPCHVVLIGQQQKRAHGDVSTTSGDIRQAQP